MVVRGIKVGVDPSRKSLIHQGLDSTDKLSTKPMSPLSSCPEHNFRQTADKILDRESCLVYVRIWFFVSRRSGEQRIRFIVIADTHRTDIKNRRDVPSACTINGMRAPDRHTQGSFPVRDAIVVQFVQWVVQFSRAPIASHGREHDRDARVWTKGERESPI